MVILECFMLAVGYMGQDDWYAAWVYGNHSHHMALNLADGGYLCWEWYV